ncbi:hypothetical protein HK102_013504 [Quaeritorhiza haematococci]|nr:hypothetical protein HK102_013504 [Quaeritorhiza haematococci]
MTGPRHTAGQLVAVQDEEGYMKCYPESFKSIWDEYKQGIMKTCLDKKEVLLETLQTKVQTELAKIKATQPTSAQTSQSSSMGDDSISASSSSHPIQQSRRKQTTRKKAESQSASASEAIAVASTSNCSAAVDFVAGADVQPAASSIRVQKQQKQRMKKKAAPAAQTSELNSSTATPNATPSTYQIPAEPAGGGGPRFKLEMALLLPQTLHTSLANSNVDK